MRNSIENKTVLRFCPSNQLTYDVYTEINFVLGDLVDNAEGRTFKIVCVHYCRDTPNSPLMRLAVAHSLDRVTNIKEHI